VWIVTFFCSFIPVVGAGPVAFVLGLTQFILGEVGAGIGMTIVALVVRACSVSSVQPYRPSLPPLFEACSVPPRYYALPVPLREFVWAGSKAIGCDPSFIALPMLSVCGAAIGNTARLKLKGNWILPPIIWSVIVGESGTAKTPAFKLVMKPVQDRQHAAMKRHAKAEQEYITLLACHKKKLGLWEKQQESSDVPPRLPDEPQAERVMIEDTTVEAVALLLAGNPRGLLLGRDEFSLPLKWV
jgi:hypothetical protein